MEGVYLFLSKDHNKIDDFQDELGANLKYEKHATKIHQLQRNHIFSNISSRWQCPKKGGIALVVHISRLVEYYSPTGPAHRAGQRGVCLGEKGGALPL
jgi:hypothetical protein